MSSNKDIKIMLKAKRDGLDPKKALKDREEKKLNGYLQIFGTGAGRSLTMGKEGIKTGKGQIIPYNDIKDIHYKINRGWRSKGSFRAIEIDYNDEKVLIKDIELGEADEFIYNIRKTIEENRNKEKANESSSFDNIKKTKELLTMGAITEEEFEKIKEKYLKMI